MTKRDITETIAAFEHELRFVKRNTKIRMVGIPSHIRAHYRRLNKLAKNIQVVVTALKKIRREYEE